MDPNDAPDHLQLQCDTIATNNSLSSTFTASWTKTGSKRFKHLLRKCWACLAQHTCARRRSRLWTLPRTAWGQDYVTLTCETSCASKPLLLSQTWPVYCSRNTNITIFFILRRINSRVSVILILWWSEQFCQISVIWFDCTIFCQNALGCDLLKQNQ